MEAEEEAVENVYAASAGPVEEETAPPEVIFTNQVAAANVE